MEFLDDPEAHRVDPKVAHTDDLPAVDLSAVEGVHPTVSIRPVDEVFGLTDLGCKLWYFEAGEEVGYHSHPTEEELYYVVDGEFSVKLGPPDDPTYRTVGPGTFFAAGPYEPHGHRCVSERGVVLAVGAPQDSDEVLDPYEQERYSAP